MTTVSTNHSKMWAMYIRISRDRGENEDTLQNHREILHEVVKRDKITEFDVYEEIVSGMKREISDRKDFSELVKNAWKYRGIIVVQIDRISRDEKISFDFANLCLDYDLLIKTPDKVYDLDDENDRTAYGFQSLFSAMEGRKIKWRFRNGKLARAKRGEWVGGNNPPYGYTKNRKTRKLVIDEEEEKVIKYIYELHLKGLGRHKICDILNAEGYRTTHEKPYYNSKIREIIRNPAYKGTIVFNERKRVIKDGKYVWIPVNTVIKDEAHKAIIPVDKWEYANEILDGRKDHYYNIRDRANTKHETPLLKDLVFCGCCGRKLAMKPDTRRKVMMIKTCEYLLPNSIERCSNSGYNLEPVEKAFLKQLDEFKKEIKGRLEQLLEQDTSAIENNLKENLKSVSKQIIEQKKMEENLINLNLIGRLTIEQFTSRQDKILENLKKLEKEQMVITEKLEKVNVENEKEKLKRLVNILENFDELNSTIQNEHLKSFVKTVYYDRKLPSDIKNLYTSHPDRKNFKPKLKIEFIN